MSHSTTENRDGQMCEKQTSSDSGEQGIPSIPTCILERFLQSSQPTHPLPSSQPCYSHPPLLFVPHLLNIRKTPLCTQVSQGPAFHRWLNPHAPTHQSIRTRPPFQRPSPSLPNVLQLCLLSRFKRARHLLAMGKLNANREKGNVKN